MNLIEKATIIHFHRHRIATCGADGVGALGWRSQESQRRRFDVIAEAVDFNACSVLDVGCGHGDLKTFLDERFSGVDYIGVDHMPEFIAHATKRFAGRDDAQFHLADFSTAQFPQVDVVVASGALGYRSADADFPSRMIRKMHAAARKAVVFNVLDAATFPGHPLLVGRERAEIVGFCSTLGGQVDVVSGYLHDDFTVVMRTIAGGAPMSTEQGSP